MKLAPSELSFWQAVYLKVLPEGVQGAMFEVSRRCAMAADEAVLFSRAAQDRVNTKEKDS
jgi:hypothetical protein